MLIVFGTTRFHAEGTEYIYIYIFQKTIVIGPNAPMVQWAAEL